VSHPATNLSSGMASIAGSISVPPTPTPTIAKPNCRFAVIRTLLFLLALSFLVCNIRESYPKISQS
jgi:hypothetical protein